KDLHDTTLFSARKLGVKPLWISPGKHLIRLDRIYVADGQFQLLTHRGDSVLNLQFLIDFFASPDITPTVPDTIPGKPWRLTCAGLELANFRFHFQDENATPVPFGMDYANIDVRNINLRMSQVVLEGDTINVSIRDLSANERSGFNLHSLQGDFRVSSRFIKTENLRIKTDHSDLSLNFAFLYPAFNAFLDFLNKVTIQANINPSNFDLTDIGFFAPDIRAMTNKFQIDGQVKGTVSKFHATDFRVIFGNNTLFIGSIFSLGLPDVTSTFVDINIDTLTTTAEDLGSFRIPGDPDTLELPRFLANFGLVGMSGNFTGFYNDFIAKVALETDIGSARTNLLLKKLHEDSLLAYKGDLSITAFDIGKLTGNTETFGRMTLRTIIDGKGLSLDEADLGLKMHVDSALVNRYNFRNFTFNGTLIHKKIFGDLDVDDPNLKLTFRGMADFSDSLPVFNFESTVSRAQLFNLHLLERDSVEVFSSHIRVDFAGNTLDNATGMIRLRNLSYVEGERSAQLDSLLVHTEEGILGEKSYLLRSDLVDADLTGKFRFSKLIPSLLTFIQNYLAGFEMRRDSLLDYQLSGQELFCHVHVKKSDEILAIFLPFLRIAPGTMLDGSYNEEQKLLALSGRSSLVSINNMFIENWTLDALTTPDDLSLKTGCDAFVLAKTNPEDSLFAQFDTLLFTANIRHDSILYGLSSGVKKDYSYIKGFLTFLDDGSTKIKLEELDLTLAGRNWTTTQDNFVLVDTSYIDIHQLSFLSKDQNLSLDGRLSKQLTDTLNISFDHVDVSELDYFFANPSIDIDGILSGQLKLTDVYNELSIYSNLRLDRFSFNHEQLGDATFKVNYNRSDDRFDVLAEIIYTGNIGKSIPFSLEGSYFIKKPSPEFDFVLKLKNLNLHMLEPFVSSFMSKLTGLVSGEVHLTGTLEEPSMEGQLKLQRTEFTIGYLNVPYSVADVIGVTPTSLNFDDIVLYDSLGNKARLNGKISHNYFRNLTLNLKIAMDDFSAFQNTFAQNKIFYGNARASGTVSITGPIDNIMVSVKASTGSKTKVAIPISLTQDVGQVDYIIFEEPSWDTLRVAGPLNVPKQSYGLSLALNLDIKPDAQVEVFFPNQLGNIKASGNGDLSMGMTPSTPFNLHGSYSIDKGSFLFQMKNLIRLPLAIEEGSTIAWTGDPTDANIALSASYKTKVPLSSITSDPLYAGIRVPVECSIRLKGKLMNPNMSFGLSMPNAEESARNLVFNLIDTNNVAETSQQVLYVLVLNQFKPIQGGSGASVDVGSTSLSIVTNQINSWLSGMSQNLNIGVNYKPATSTANSEFDVAVSTQLFNDRLLIDGTFGMSSYKNTSSSQASTIVGDINIDYLLTKNRRWRIRAFNRTNTIDVLFNNAPYTQGVGISYQRDFSNWAELFTLQKKPKKR
ncbi:MAG: translocation/assembly module TamB domain-containing protein, partial [bacterium]